jgi:hypothetical protein
MYEIQFYLAYHKPFLCYFILVTNRGLISSYSKNLSKDHLPYQPNLTSQNAIFWSSFEGDILVEKYVYDV